MKKGKFLYKKWICRGVAAVVLCALLLLPAILLTGSERFAAAPLQEETPQTPQTTEEAELPHQTADESDEMRGVYVATVLNLNFPSKPGLSEEELKKEIDRIVQTSVSAGLNTIFFQVRPTGDALYVSKIFPSSRYLVKTEGESLAFDPFAYFITACREAQVSPIAWVNPYRITNFTSENAEEALAALSDRNPAKIHPDWCIFYGGKLMYNPALPEVQELILSGIREICENYDVDGVLYDDYFYPYPVSGESFKDAEDYAALAASGQSLADWRRENVNTMIRKTYETIKGIDSELSFGVSPFGVWQNKASDPRGSKTSAFESYSSLYCDPLAWIEGGYIDYISPQIYWERGYSAADFAELTRWWSAQVDGTAVKLIPSHAVYKVSDWKLGADEICQQVQFARAYMNVGGSIFYSYAAIAENTAGVRDALSELYEDAFSVSESVPFTGRGISFSFPRNSYSTTLPFVFVLASSDPSVPVYSETGKVARTKSGFFSIHQALNYGANRLTLSQNGEQYTLVINRVQNNSSNDLGRFMIKSTVPAKAEIAAARSGKKLDLQVVAPSGSVVSASIGGQTVRLNAQGSVSGSGEYIAQTYTGTYTMPVVRDGEEMQKIGTIIFTCTRNEKSVSAEGGELFVIPENLHLKATVVKDYSFLKISPTSSFYEDYLNTNRGMEDEIIAQQGKYYQLAFGGWIHEDNIAIEKSAALSAASIGAVSSESKDGRFEILFPVSRSVPIHAKIKDGALEISLFHLASSGTASLAENPLFSAIRKTPSGDRTVFSLSLYNVENFYGFDYTYTDSGILFSFTLPQKLPDSETPLQGKRIIVDAGHGGNDSGALGYLSGHNEKDLNLSVALALSEKLKALGAEVFLTRSDDTAVSLNERMDFLNEIHPDFCVSVHHNSVVESSDTNAARGVLGLYWSDAGLGLAKPLQQSVRQALSAYNYGVNAQELALCRNYKFPQALLELGFICSPAEYERQLRADYADTCAEAIANGVLEYYRNQAGFLEGNR